VKQVHTFCRICEPSCGLLASVEGGELVELEPDREHPVTKGFACHKGMATLDVHRDPDRLGAPLCRSADGSFDTVGWDTALGAIASRTQAIREQHGPDAVGFYIGNPTAFNTLGGQGIGSFARQVGSRQIFGSGTQDCANKFAAGEAVFGTSTLHPVPDLEHADVIWIFGENPRVSHMSFFSIPDPMAVLRRASKRGASVRFVNPRRVESAVGVGAVVQIRPDTDVYLMAGILHELDQRGHFREDLVAAHARNIEGLREFVAEYPPERVAAVVGISADEIRELAGELATARGAALHMSTGVNMGRQGTLAYWLLHMLSFVTGNLDARGGSLYSQGFYSDAPRSGRRDPAKDFFDSPYGRLRRIRGSLPGNLLAESILGGEERSKIRALFVMSGNPLLTIGGEAGLREAFESLELLVCIDIYRNATGELADFLLPATDMLERADINLCGLGNQYQPYVQYTPAVVEPRDERREEWWIFARLEQAMGFKSVLDAGDEPATFARIDHMLRERQLSVAQLETLPHQTAVLPPPEPGAIFERFIQTEDGRIDCCPALFADALRRCAEIFDELSSRPADLLSLISRRDLHMHNSWLHNIPSMKGRGKQTNALYLHPDDAAALGVAAGAGVRVENEHGSLTAVAALDDTLRPGVVAMTHGWGNAATPGMSVAQRYPGVNANVLLPSGPDSFEPLSMQAHMTGVPVRVSAGGASGNPG